MAYKIDSWDLTDIPEDQIERGDKTSNFVKFTEPGLKTVKIVDVKRYDEYTAPKPELSDTYEITIESVEEGPEFGAKAKLTYFLKNKEKTMFNENTLGTLRSVGKALFNDEFTGMVPRPDNILGGVLVADVKFGKPDSLGRVFPRVYHFSAASQDFAMWSDIDQYFKRAGGQ